MEILQRKYCNKCQNYKLFESLNDSEIICQTCKNKFEIIDLTNIPKDKILEQQTRFENSEIENFMNKVKKLPLNDIIIIEDLAGINPNDSTFRNKINSKLHKAYTNYNSKFYNIGRNNSCPCGSGKKYKNCCIGRNSYYSIPKSN